MHNELLPIPDFLISFVFSEVRYGKINFHKGLGSSF